MFERASGVLVHPTSFPSRYGMGDLGAGAYAFINFLKAAKQSLWQVLPLGPTGYGDSPYQSFSSFAGNHYLISPDILKEQGWLTNDDLLDIPQFDPRVVDFGPVITYKMSLLKKAYAHFKLKATTAQKTHFTKFCKANKDWLDDYALFVAIKGHFIEARKNDMECPLENKDYYYGAVWNSWPEALAKREPKALAEIAARLSDEIDFCKFLQCEFFRQWDTLKAYANKAKIQIIGDIPIFVAGDSADVWASPELYQLDKNNNPTAVAGVPPDYFSETGQLWGNPLYDWNAHKKTDFAWWCKRISAVLSMVDIVRIDHFRGFEDYWAVPSGEETAVNGKWKKGPGKAFFTALKKQLGSLPIIAEDLGIITEKVTALRLSQNLPGMRVLQFAFDANEHSPHIPHCYEDSLTVVYSGTHDNNTTRGWYDSASDTERDHLRRYLNVSGDDVHWDLIRLAFSTTAVFAIVPIQDIMGLGENDRMNSPGIASGWWKFRYTQDMLLPDYAERLAYLSDLFDRSSFPILSNK
ncbi:MAG: 4-alpha-glucanotransferase [Defluviitaleaceae bacterium]|nr:4-alpha-glucanotransferase [Defluviitaleaceae bacterium]